MDNEDEAVNHALLTVDRRLWTLYNEQLTISNEDEAVNHALLTVDRRLWTLYN
jgi:predicted nucleic acid-binding protein